MRVHWVAAILAVLTLATASHAQNLNITGLDNTVINANLLADSLVGQGITRVGNASLVGANGQQGTFSTSGGGSAGVIGFRDGILLTTGLAQTAAGPNDMESAGTFTGTGSTPEFLDGLDANVLEFQFTIAPNITNLRFSYVFASEEYPEFVGADNDVFGLFVNGVNVALLPEPAAVGTEVGINTVNADTNAPFYLDNASSASNGQSAFSTQYDGLTTVLTTANITPLLHEGTNTLRIVVADRGDEAYDSAVFLMAHSMTQDGVFRVAAVETPEPGTIVLLGTVLLGMGGRKILRRRKTS